MDLLKYPQAQVCINVQGKETNKIMRYVTAPELYAIVRLHAPADGDGNPVMDAVVDRELSPGLTGSFVEATPAAELSRIVKVHGKNVMEIMPDPTKIPTSFSDMKFSWLEKKRKPEHKREPFYPKGYKERLERVAKHARDTEFVEPDFGAAPDAETEREALTEEVTSAKKSPAKTRAKR